MEPMEINAGRFYLRALRSDERVDDLPAIREHDPASGEEFLDRRAAGWADEHLLSWAVCEQTDVDLLALVECAVSDSDGQAQASISGWARTSGDPARRGLADQALAEGSAAVERFAEGALGLRLLST